jgi:hypothetical protein
MAKNCLIYEALNDIKGMKVKKEGDLMTLSGVFGVCGVRNNNQRVYETSNYSKMVTEMQQRIKAEGGIPGELEHPQSMNITLENISHKITDINIDENGVVTGSITLLNTPKGQIAQAIVEGGLPLFISSRASGNVEAKTGNVTLERIATYDLVGTPGFSQARLNLNENQIAESINESMVYYIGEKEEEVKEEIKENKEDMELKEILEKLDELTQKVSQLEEENETLREQLEEVSEGQIDVEKLCNGIQNWIVEEYSPMVQEWITEEYSDEIVDMIEENQNDIDLDEITEHVVDEIAPEIQNWVCEEFAPEVQGWICEEFAPGVQEWVVEEYAPEVEKWITENYSSKVQDMIQESKKSNLSDIESTLQLLENIDVKKPRFSSKSMVVENLDEPKFVREMPAEKRVQWDLASNEVKESITRKAKLYNLVNEDAIARFWEGVNFEEVTPTRSIYEGLEQIEDEREREIRMKIRAYRFHK